MGKNDQGGSPLECVSLGQREGKMLVETSIFEGVLHGSWYGMLTSRVGKLSKLKEFLKAEFLSQRHHLRTGLHS